VAALLEVENVSRRFGGVVALDGVSLDAGENEIVGLIGPNGAGKTTLFNVVTHISRPDSSERRYAGRRLLRTPAHRIVRRGIARTFQKIRLFKQLTLLENVLAGFHIHQDAPFWEYLVYGDTGRFREEARSLLAFVGLEARSGERAGALPYGQQRMLEIARALATRPRLFMLDEPAAGLNAAEVDFLLKRLEQIGRQGVTVLVVEHNMDLVMNVAHRVFVMDHGEPLFEGTPREVQHDPAVIAAYLGGEFAS